MGDQANLPQALFGLGTGAVVYAANANISGQGDIYCDTFTVSGSGTVLTAFANRIVARTKITVGGGAVIAADGVDGSGVGTGSGGATHSIGIFETLGGGNSGADGANGSGNGGDASAFSNGRPIGGGGGFGGSSTGHSGGNPGSIVNSAILANQDKDFSSIIRGWALTQNIIYLFGGGTGGGGGSADGAVGGGGGGAGGEVLYLCAPVIEIDGSVHANGGMGSDGVAASAGGGGGGGGGLIILIYNELIVSGALVTLGGVGGNGAGVGGTNGTNGDPGHIYHINGLSNQLGPVV